MKYRQWMGVLVVQVLAVGLVSAANPPGYERYKDGHEGYLGDGILTPDEDPTAELAHYFGFDDDHLDDIGMG